MSNIPGDRFLDCITLGGVKGVPVQQQGGMTAFIEMSRTVNRMFQLRAGDLSDTKIIKYSRHRPWEFLDLPDYLPGKLWCSGCGAFKWPDEFHKDSRNKSGRHSHCKDCRNKHDREMYAKQKYDGAFLKTKTIIPANIGFKH